MPDFDSFVANPFGALILQTLCHALPPDTDPHAAYEAFAAFGASDPIEQMLAAQAVAAHFAAMACLGRAMEPDADPKTADRARGRAAALGRMMRDTIKTMEKRKQQAGEHAQQEAEQTETPDPIRPTRTQFQAVSSDPAAHRKTASNDGAALASYPAPYRTT